MTRDEMLTALARAVLAVRVPHPTRVGIDGCSAAGKTTLADELAEVLGRHTERPVIRVELDYFKRAVHLRTAYPYDSPESYYLDSWDNEAIREKLLAPLGPGGDRRYRTALMDLSATTPVDEGARIAGAEAILLADGCFLQRPQLRPYWDFVIFVDVDFADVLRRGVERDQAWMGSAAEAEARYHGKYLPGERRYVREVRPREVADVAVDNRDFTAPRILTPSPPRSWMSSAGGAAALIQDPS